MKRDANGRFAKGNRGGPGRPKKARDERYYEILQQACTFDSWKKIIDKAVEQALDGDKDARKFLAGYLMGEPDRYLEIAGGGGGPLLIQKVAGFDEV